MGLHRTGRLAEAEAIYARILDGRPRDPDALHYLGVLRHQQGRGDEGVELIERAIALAPDHADAHNNLGNVLKELDRIEEAVVAYRRALALRPDDAPILNNLGIALRWLGQVDAAIALHRQAVAVAPRMADAHYSLGRALRRQGDLEGAIAAFERAIEIRPTHANACQSLGRALYRMGRDAEAARVYARWLAHEPHSPVARHMLAACSGRDVPPRAADAYIREVFDGFAERFDVDLDHLEYCAPRLVADALAAVAGAPPPAREMLDAGCGTGLCGPLLRPHARRLVGVDLSPAMLARARHRGVYDELVEAELTAYLEARPHAFDVIVSADTLVYFGDLRPVLAAAAGALRPGGLLLFTAERADPGDEAIRGGYRLNPHGRYSHTGTYLGNELAAAGLGVSALTEATLRREAGRPVAGHVVTARKSEERDP